MIDDPMNILVPGRGLVNLDAEKVNRAAQEYDERLRFGFNEANGDWVLYIRMPREFDSFYRIDGDPVYPVLGFGSEVPHPDEALGRVQRSDSWKIGAQIYDRVVSSQHRARNEAEQAADEATQETAERLAHHAKEQGIW